MYLYAAFCDWGKHLGNFRHGYTGHAQIHYTSDMIDLDLQIRHRYVLGMLSYMTHNYYCIHAATMQLQCT